MINKTNAKIFWNASVAGGLFGAMLTSWLAPKLIAWYFDPPVDIGVNCRSATEWSMNALQRAQTLGLLAGIALGVSITIIFQKKALANKNLK